MTTHSTRQEYTSGGDVLTEESLAALFDSLIAPPLCSGRIVTSDMVREQFRFPRSKKKRIQNKWARRDANWRPARHALIDNEGTIYLHPKHLHLFDAARAKTP